MTRKIVPGKNPGYGFVEWLSGLDNNFSVENCVLNYELEQSPTLVTLTMAAQEVDGL